ncbi:CueP family metal-binding protein [Salirhabdus sp. Marseille-P4669]|uniref:CueP family metal-binding protein n=1 Tax=Salirhabdus sp. Marseille-P4669 TaxID=2042310 RepID=UPI000C7B92AD|nr:CueP family metal-binding protein [Salirhabdus sp. Marseille-P4669]
MKNKILILASVVIVAVVAIWTINNSTKDEAKEVNIKELVEDYSLRNITSDNASITSTQLVVTEGDRQTAYDLPEDEFFVSIAPFLTTTHPCEMHSLTGCQGEMVEQEFDVYIEDEDGNVIVDEKMTSLSNGFLDLWLPSDKTYHATITHEGKVAERVITTFEGDNTCITTMQLKDEQNA